MQMDVKHEIEHIDAKIQEALAQRQKLADEYTTFHNQVANQIEKILKDAKVFDLIRALEVGRDTRRATDQAQVDAIGKKIDEFSRQKAKLLETVGEVQVQPVAPETAASQPEAASPKKGRRR
jgi:hypothetical protein